MIVIVLAFRRPPSAPTLWLFAIGRMPARSVGELDIDATGRTAANTHGRHKRPLICSPRAADPPLRKHTLRGRAATSDTNNGRAWRDGHAIICHTCPARTF